ncbi:hypothetical protein PR048_019115 [Dryococelus australis]|uniref:Uncharacterized protein n=1 Tax=Dryococelus australis TaxID=614101 RepID=A0ABQ9H2K6_9NEOP|nr:hypothetical protein PR048_019115 [Dryococelus australis]
MEWTRDRGLRSSDECEKFPMLYDTKSPNYHNKHLRENALQVWRQRRKFKGTGKREIPEKFRPSATSSDTIPTREKLRNEPAWNRARFDQELRKSFCSPGGFDVYNIETAMPKIDLEAIEAHLRAAREEERRLGSPLVDERPIMNAVKNWVVFVVIWTNRTMVSSNTDTKRTSVLAVVDIGPCHTIPYKARLWSDSRRVRSRILARGNRARQLSLVGGGRGGLVVRLLAFHRSEPGLIPGCVAPAYLHVEIVPDDATVRRVFSVISPPPLRIPALLHTHLTSPSSALKTSMPSNRATSTNPLFARTTPQDYFLWGHTKGFICHAFVESEEELLARVTAATDLGRPGIGEDEDKQRTVYCICGRGQHVMWWCFVCRGETFLQDVLPGCLEGVPSDAREAMWFQQDGVPPRRYMLQRRAACEADATVADGLNTRFEQRHRIDTLHILDDSAPIAEFQGNKKRIPYNQMRVNTGATAKEQTSEVQLHKRLWSLAYRRQHGVVTTLKSLTKDDKGQLCTAGRIHTSSARPRPSVTSPWQCRDRWPYELTAWTNNWTTANVSTKGRRRRSIAADAVQLCVCELRRLSKYADSLALIPLKH